MTERPKVRHWKCRVRVKLHRGFESHPLRSCASLELATGGAPPGSMSLYEGSMRCWNCGRKVTRKAKVCGHCEADLTEVPSAEEQAAVMELLEQMPPDVLAELSKAMSESASAEEFANRILVGPCPSCGCDQTGDCEGDPEIGELLVGRCYECGHLWCTECGSALTRKSFHCACCDEADE